LRLQESTMRMQTRLLIITTTVFAFICIIGASDAQPGKKGKRNTETMDEFVAKLMVFDKDKDGKLTKEELFDGRLHALFDRADTKKKGYIPRDDLEALFTRENDAFGPGDGKKGKGPKGPPDKKGPPPDKKGPPPDGK